VALMARYARIAHRASDSWSNRRRGMDGRQGRAGGLATAAIVLGALLAGTGPGKAVGAEPSPALVSDGASARPGPAHVFVIVMENHGYDDLVGAAAAPWINDAVARYGVADRSYAVAHPSQPDYIALTSGGTQGVVDDRDVVIDVPNLVDQLESQNRTWTGYMQSFDTCSGDVLRTFCGGQLYARKHDPFVSYQDIASNPDRLVRIVDLSQLDADLASRSVADLAWITPDLCHDMHGISGREDVPCAGFDDAQLIAAGDAFLEATVRSIIASSSWTPGSVLFVTWDEAGGRDTSGCCGSEPAGGHILTLVIGYGGGSRRSQVPYDHYSLLATIEGLLGLPCLGQACLAKPMWDLVAVPDAPGSVLRSIRPGS